MANLVPLTEAAAFTCGCAVLRTRWFDPEWVGAVLTAAAATMILILLIAATPESITTDPQVLDAAGIWPQPQ